MASVENLASTDLTTAYSKDYFDPGTTYIDKDTGGMFVWGAYSDGAGNVTAGPLSVCIPLVSSTNSAIFSADQDTTGYDASHNIHCVYAPARMADGKRGWFRCKGRHKVREASTTTGLAKGTLFRPSGTDATIRACAATSQQLASGITCEAFSVSATSLKEVILFGRIWT